MISSPIWLPAALSAGLLQAWRTAMQQRLRAELSVNGAGLVRYLYGAPLALLLGFGCAALQGPPLPHCSALFLLLAALGGLLQIIGTNLLILAFGYRNFVVGTAFSKTEAVQAALFAWLVLGERLSGLALLGILAGVSGVLLLALGGETVRRGDRLAAVLQPAALCGLGAGTAFALTGVVVKGALGSLGMPDPLAAALITLMAVNSAQLLMQGGYVLWREPGTLVRIFASWRLCSLVGILAALGSACWFTGFAAAPVALVRIVGQVEVVFTLAFARFYLGERTRRHESIGLLLVSTGVVLALLGSG